jgi:hypothetical protein
MHPRSLAPPELGFLLDEQHLHQRLIRNVPILGEDAKFLEQAARHNFRLPRIDGLREWSMGE